MKVRFTKKELRVISYCLFAEYGADYCWYKIDGVVIHDLRKKIKEYLGESINLHRKP